MLCICACKTALSLIESVCLPILLHAAVGVAVFVETVAEDFTTETDFARDKNASNLAEVDVVRHALKESVSFAPLTFGVPDGRS